MSARAREGPAEREGEHRCGFAVLVGRANVGKSTLLNRLVEQKVAIVSPVPQTTRQRIVGVRTLPHGQVVFLDTPGFHRPHHRLGEMLNERARQTISEADVLVFVVDASEGMGTGDRFVREQLDEHGGKAPVLLVPNKLDRMNKGRVLPLIESALAEGGYEAAVPVSAATGDNCDRLLEVIVGLLPVGPPLYPREMVTDQGERKLVAELIREPLLHKLRQELPHAVAVKVEAIQVREDGLAEIHATIFVERKSQKRIVVGHRGAMIKEIGTAARRELEAALGRRVFLELWVKVREDWRDKTATLGDLGITVD